MTRSLVGPAPAGPSVVPRVDPRLVAVAGSLCIAFSPIFIALADVSPGTATFFRCALALPLLVPLALLERRRRLRSSPTTGNRPVVLFVGGALLGLDMTLWAESVHAVGAGVSTVLVNVQVVILPLLAFLVLGERVRRTFVLAVPVMLVGVALAGGLIGDPEAVTGVAPVRGTVTALIAAAAYAGYLLFVRLGAGPGQRFTPVAIATVGAAVTSFAVGSFWQGIDLAPDARSLMWLVVLAIVGQVVGWVLIASALPRLASSTGASILLLQPVGAVLLGALVLAEVPGVLQLVGCAVVLGAVAVAARVRAAPTGAGRGARSRGARDLRVVIDGDFARVEAANGAFAAPGHTPGRPRRARCAWSSGRRACRTCPSSDSAAAPAPIERGVPAHRSSEPPVRSYRLPRTRPRTRLPGAVGAGGQNGAVAVSDPSAAPLGAVVPDRAGFHALAAHHRVIPVTRRLLADGETPVGLYRKLAGRRPGTFLFESAEHGESWSRWTLRRGAQRRRAHRAGRPRGVDRAGAGRSARRPGRRGALGRPAGRPARDAAAPAHRSAARPAAADRRAGRLPRLRRRPPARARARSTPPTTCSCPRWSCCWPPTWRRWTTTRARSRSSPTR